MTTVLKSLAENVSSQEFEAWKKDLSNYLRNDPIFKQFLPGGNYESWQSLSESNSGYRINSLHASETKHAIQSWEDLLLIRNEQLSQMLKLIGSFIKSDEYPAIYSYSTSLDMILQFIFEFRNIDSKPKSIYQLNQFTYNDGDDFNEFYHKFRSVISLNLLKKGDKVNDDILLEDEVISPTFDEIIMIWSLEKINPHLPQLVQVTFSDQLCHGTSLKDLQEDIFEFIPALLEKIDSQENIEDNHDVDKYEQTEDYNDSYVKMEQGVEDNCEINDKEVSSYPVVAETYSIENKINTETLKRSIEKEVDVDKNICLPIVEVDMIQNEKDDPDYAPCLSESKEIDILKCTLCGGKTQRRSMRRHMKLKHGIDFNLNTFSENKENEDYNIRGDGSSLPEETLKSKKIVKRIITNCPICDRKVRRSDIKFHMLFTHNVELTTKDVEEMNCGNSNVQNADADEGDTMCFKCGKELIMYKRNAKRHILRCRGIKRKKKETEKDRGNKGEKGVEGKDYFCDKCGKLHARGRHTCTTLSTKTNKNVRCDTCKRTFFDEEHKEKHKCALWECDKCGAEFIWKRNYEMHKKEHDGVKLFACQECEGLFLTKRRLRHHHYDNHEEEKRVKRFPCDSCDKMFSKRSALNQHVKIVHVGIRDFSCQKCDKKFKTKYGLDSHINRFHNHIHIKDYPCKVCGHVFESRKLMAHHLELGKCKGRKLEEDEDEVAVSYILPQNKQLQLPDKQIEDPKDHIVVQSVDGLLFKIKQK